MTDGGRALAVVFLTTVVIVLAGFAVGEVTGLSPHVDPADHTPSAGSTGSGLAADLAAVAVGIGLLVVDVLAPVPSSAVMAALGARFGVAGGTALAVAGGLGSLWLASRIGGRLATRYDVGDRPRVRAWVDRWGALAVVASRPIPVLAESVAITAAAGGMGRTRLLVAGALGLVPFAVACAAAGHALVG